MPTSTKTASRPRHQLGTTFLLAWSLSVLLAGCNEGSTTPESTRSLAIATGNDQLGVVGASLDASLVVTVSNAEAKPVAGTVVVFQVTGGAGSVSPARVTSDVNGRAASKLKLGDTPGAVKVTATIQGSAASVTFAATATAALNPACEQANAAQLAVGEVRPTLAGTSVCLPGGSTGADYALIAFNGAPSAKSVSSITLTPSGVYPVTTSANVVAEAGQVGGVLRSTSPSDVSSDLPRRRADFTPPAAQRNVLRSLLPAARRVMNARRSGLAPSLSVIPSAVTVGQLLSLNANANDACTVNTLRPGRVVAVTNKAIVVADTTNPAGGFTDAEYLAFANTFDNVVDPMDTGNFGQPTDIDGNGHVLLFFTKSVNQLTPRNADYYVSGFFYARDLFPPNAPSSADACATSNYGEMFYLMVPDPTGQVNGNTFAKSNVTTIVTATVAHEYQHLINASRRLYVNTQSVDFEETWLDEGLSHVAEELLFYAESKLGPRQDLSAATLRGTTAYRDAFNEYAIENFLRLERFLQNPSTNSPYADNDSLATRGATWSFLRFAVDHQSVVESSVWNQLENSTSTGFANLQQVFGSALGSLFRDWSTSLFVDNLASATSGFFQPSWNYPSIFAAIASGNAYPLRTTSLTSGAPATLRVGGGGSLYLPFTVTAGTLGAVSWTATTAGVNLSLVRTR